MYEFCETSNSSTILVLISMKITSFKTQKKGLRETMRSPFESFGGFFFVTLCWIPLTTF